MVRLAPLNMFKPSCDFFLTVSETVRKRGSSVVRHLPLVLEVPGSIPARGEKNFGVRTSFL